VTYLNKDWTVENYWPCLGGYKEEEEGKGYGKIVWMKLSGHKL